MLRDYLTHILILMPLIQMERDAFDLCIPGRICDSLSTTCVRAERTAGLTRWCGVAHNRTTSVTWSRGAYDVGPTGLPLSVRCYCRTFGERDHELLAVWARDRMGLTKESYRTSTLTSFNPFFYSRCHRQEDTDNKGPQQTLDRD